MHLLILLKQGDLFDNVVKNSQSRFSHRSEILRGTSVPIFSGAAAAVGAAASPAFKQETPLAKKNDSTAKRKHFMNHRNYFNGLVNFWEQRVLSTRSR
jgi:hypothetical protein